MDNASVQRITPQLLPFQQRLGRAHVFVFVVDSHDNHMFGGGVFLRLQRYLEVVVFVFASER